MYLVDTNIISAASPARTAPGRAVPDWMKANSGRLFLSVMTVAQIKDGIAKSGREGARRKAQRLTE